MKKIRVDIETGAVTFGGDLIATIVEKGLITPNGDIFEWPTSDMGKVRGFSYPPIPAMLGTVTLSGNMAAAEIVAMDGGVFTVQMHEDGERGKLYEYNPGEGFTEIF